MDPAGYDRWEIGRQTELEATRTNTLRRLSKIAKRKAAGEQAAAAFERYTSMRVAFHLIAQRRNPIYDREDSKKHKESWRRWPISRVRIWSGGAALTKTAIWQLLEVEGFAPFEWSGRANAGNELQSLPHARIIWVVRGSITFILPNEDREITLNRGDRLELPPDIPHRTVTVSSDLVCLEARRD